MDKKAIQEGYNMAKRARLSEAEGEEDDVSGVATNASQAARELALAVKQENKQKIRSSLHEVLDNLSFLSQELVRAGLLKDSGDRLVSALEKAEAAVR